MTEHTQPFITPQPWMIEAIQKEVKEYLKKHDIKALIIGISGGFDSGFNAALLRPVCYDLQIPLIGRYIHIVSNKPEEKERAIAIGKAFCNDFQEVDLDQLYFKAEHDVNFLEEPIKTETEFQKKIRLGNIKARLRMIYLYNLASMKKGIVVDNDNKSERQLGFYTLHGDVGSITPLADFFKTEAYHLAEIYNTMLHSEEQKKALQMVIDAVPTDGLGITSSDVEQFGVPSYYEVDKILAEIENGAYKVTDVCPFTHESGIKIWNRWKNSNFKRHYPYRVRIFDEL